MIKKDLGLSSYEEVSCPYCDTKVGNDLEGNQLGDCEHHVYYFTDLVDPVTEYEILKIENLYDDYDEDNDFWSDYLDEKLDDNYLMIHYNSHGGGTYHIFHKK